MNRRSFLLTVAAAGLAGRTSAQSLPPRINVYKSPTCGCCSAWVDHMARAGFAVDAQDIDQESLYALKAQSGITPDLASCHTALVDGYVVEGHVPVADVERLLAERPEAIGLSVPGMPIGSPGMEMGNQHDAFDTLLVMRDGSTEVFQRHA
ncbi:DUF411 domain-containing protein [Jannaschia seohaensis]|uniref:Uncharacterized conserved protein n=1 Tax=Jannaschia seohaensis TaxID=475081 RepID=A0A2Y9AB64_9RHOB|nr:DUF411 domain-containing protein [Jannaschia seohaensis]PWJ20796.1 hypothetical protein BCF38_10241 [Jannaschia seohaensis]SSA41206.1 Uncharacterized conserved protein [Jannaschia seohaensis]